MLQQACLRTIQGDARAGASKQLATAKGTQDANTLPWQGAAWQEAPSGAQLPLAGSTHHADGVVSLRDDVARGVAGRRADGRQGALQARQEGACARVQPPHHLPRTSLLGAACTSAAAHAPAAFISDQAPFLYIQELTMCRMKW